MRACGPHLIATKRVLGSLISKIFLTPPGFVNGRCNESGGPFPGGAHGPDGLPLVWNSIQQPQVSSFAWSLLGAWLGPYPSLGSNCCLCNADMESTLHLLSLCSFASAHLELSCMSSTPQVLLPFTTNQIHVGMRWNRMPCPITNKRIELIFHSSSPFGMIISLSETSRLNST